MIWILCGLASAFCAAIVSAIAAKNKGDIYATAVWNQTVFVVLSLPFVVFSALPTDPVYYALLLSNAALYCLSDIVTLRNTPIVGAAVSSQIKRTAILITFFLWLAVSPALLWKYYNAPLAAGAVLCIHLLAVYFAMRIKKKDGVPWKAFKLMWLPILAGATTPIISKLAIGYFPDASQAIFTTMFLQGIIMITLWAVTDIVRSRGARLLPLQTMIQPHTLRAGLMLGATSYVAAIFVNYGYAYADNPTYISVLRLTDTLWLLLFHKMQREPDNTDVTSGMGIVGCAAALILIKIFFE